MNLSPHYIALDKPNIDTPDNWQVILIDLIPVSKFPEIHMKKIGTNKKTYLHLELHELYRAGHGNIVINGFKENTFALGLIILELAFDIDMKHLYENKYQLLKSKDNGRSPGSQVEGASQVQAAPTDLRQLSETVRGNGGGVTRQVQIEIQIEVKIEVCQKEKKQIEYQLQKLGIFELELSEKKRNINFQKIHDQVKNQKTNSGTVKNNTWLK